MREWTNLQTDGCADSKSGGDTAARRLRNLFGKLSLGRMQQASCSGRGLLEAGALSSKNNLHVRPFHLPLKTFAVSDARE